MILGDLASSSTHFGERLSFPPDDSSQVDQSISLRPAIYRAMQSRWKLFPSAANKAGLVALGHTTLGVAAKSRRDHFNRIARAGCIETWSPSCALFRIRRTDRSSIRLNEQRKTGNISRTGQREFWVACCFGPIESLSLNESVGRGSQGGWTTWLLLICWRVARDTCWLD